MPSLSILLDFWWNSISPSDILTSLIAPLLFFLAGTYIERRRRKYDESKRAKEDEIKIEKEKTEFIILKENVIGWIQRINEKINEQIIKINKINLKIGKTGYDKLNLDVVPIPVDRLLSFSDLDIRKIIDEPKHYLDVITGLSFVKEVERDLQQLFSKFESDSFNREQMRVRLNREGYEVVFNLESLSQPLKYLTVLRISLQHYMNQEEVENYDPNKFYSFLNEIQDVIDKQIEFKEVEPEETINSFFDFHEKYENFIDDVTFSQGDFLERMNFILANLKLIESYNSSFLMSIASNPVSAD